MAEARSMTDVGVLRDQYGDGGRLSARRALWGLRTGPPLHRTVLDLAALEGAETVVDVGCGIGVHLAELRRRGHTGPVLGLDRSGGMARQARAHARTAVADAQALPLGDGTVDVALCLHMLYHVPDPGLAVAQLRRVLRPGGTAVVATNGTGHAAELKQVLMAAAGRVTGAAPELDWDARRFDPATARDLLRGAFHDVTVHAVGDAFQVRDPAVVVAYLASFPPESVGLRAGPGSARVLAAVEEVVAAHFATHGSFTVTSEPVVLRCR
jgi:SAM-dependent methyltransferase